METLEVNYTPYGTFLIKASSDMIRWRAKTFLYKEPTTLDWLQSLGSKSILIDVGANIGIYSIPAALFHVEKVYAIEPELKNFTELSHNISINSLDKSKIQAIPVAVSTEYDQNVTDFFLTADEPGMSCHQLGRNQDFKLNPIKKIRVTRSVFAVSLEKIVSYVLDKHPNQPLHIKIDVDGIESDVCSSLFSSRLIHSVTSLQIELSPNIPTHASLLSQLASFGFSFDTNQVSKATRKDGAFKDFAEYVFRRHAPTQFIQALPRDLQSLFSPVAPGSLSHYTCCLSLKPEQSCFNPLSTFHETSTIPPAYIVKNELNPEFKSSFSTAVLDSLSASEPLKALKNSYIAPIQRRSAVNLDVFSNNHPLFFEYLKCFVRSKATLANIVGNCTNTLFKYLRPDTFFLQSKHDLYVFARARLFIDFKDFYLTRHNDSYDTLFAYICPLSDFPTTTSLVTEIPTAGSVRNFEEVAKRSSFESTFSNNATWYHNHSDNSFVYEIATDSSNNKALKKYVLTPIHTKPNESILIPNPLFKYYGETNPVISKKLLNTSYGHAVFPPISEPTRPLLLVDYIISTLPTDNPASRLYLTNNSVINFICPLSELNSMVKSAS